MKKFFLFFFIFLAFNLYGKISFNWYWGIQRLNNINSFIINFLPEYNSKFLNVKLELPVEFRSNFQFQTNCWNNNNDIIPKIDYIDIKLYDGLNISFKAIKNFSLANNVIFYKYSNYIFYPNKKYIGFLLDFFVENLKVIFLVDNVQKFNFYNTFVSYNFSEFFKSGFMWVRTINDYNIFNFLINYKFFKNKRFYID